MVLQSYFRTYSIASVLLCTGLCRGGGIRLGQGGKSEIAHRGAERQHESLTLYLLQGAKACPGQKGGTSLITSTAKPLTRTIVEPLLRDDYLHFRETLQTHEETDKHRTEYERRE